MREKQKLLARVRRIRGQVEAIERALEAEAGCDKVMHILASTRAAVAGLMAEVIEDHVRTHLVDPEKHPDALDQEAAEDLLTVVRRFSITSALPIMAVPSPHSRWSIAPYAPADQVRDETTFEAEFGTQFLEGWRGWRQRNR